MNFVLRRLIFVLPTLLGVIILTFFIGRIAPGDPFLQLYGLGVDDQTLADLRRHYGLDQPLWQQLLVYMANLFQGDLGVSFVRANTKVTDLIANAIVPTLTVGCLSIVLGSFVGILLGIWSAVKHSKLTDKVITALVSTFGAMPGFVVAYMLVWIIAVNLRWFPPGGWGRPENIVLPVIVASFAPAAFIARVCRSSLIEVLRHQFVVVAHSKGLPARDVMRFHVMKNSLIPIVTIIGPLAARSITSLFFVEKIFGIPGLATLTLDSVPSRDYSVIQGCTLVLAIVFILFNLSVDIINSKLDPRLSAS